jgi:hypothetical protein
MKKQLSGVLVLLFGVSAGLAKAQQLAAFSSSASGAEAAGSSAIVATEQRLPKQKNTSEDRAVRPFSRIAVGTRLGSLGLGAQVATPLMSRLNLRGSANFFNFSYGANVDGADYDSQLRLKSGMVSVDYFPFHSSFHVSPGIMIFKSTADAAMNVAGGNSFSLGDTTYTSDPNDPIHGSGTMNFGRTIMPALTVGFGNMITRREGSHWSVPFDIGLGYTGQNRIKIGLAGSACQQGFCMSTSDPTIQQNVVQEQNDINESMKRFKIYPILTSGVSYRF